MPRGDNPNSRKNLIVNSERTPKERKKQAEKAGKASGEARALKKTISESLKELCTPDVLEAMNLRIISMAKHGNLKAYELVRDGLGEKPGNNGSAGGAIEYEDDGFTEAIKASAVDVWGERHGRKKKAEDKAGSKV